MTWIVWTAKLTGWLAVQGVWYAIGWTMYVGLAWAPVGFLGYFWVQGVAKGLDVVLGRLVAAAPWFEAGVRAYMVAMQEPPV